MMSGSSVAPCWTFLLVLFSCCTFFMYCCSASGEFSWKQVKTKVQQKSVCKKIIYVCFELNTVINYSLADNFNYFDLQKNYQKHIWCRCRMFHFVEHLCRFRFVVVSSLWFVVSNLGNFPENQVKKIFSKLSSYKQIKYVCFGYNTVNMN